MVSLQHWYLDDEAMYRLAGVVPKRNQALSPFETGGTAANTIRRFSGRTAMLPVFGKNKNVNTIKEGLEAADQKTPIKERFRLYSFRPSH
jgi:hypothetical protein